MPTRYRSVKPKPTPKAKRVYKRLRLEHQRMTSTGEIAVRFFLIPEDTHVASINPRFISAALFRQLLEKMRFEVVDPESLKYEKEFEELGEWILTVATKGLS